MNDTNPSDKKLQTAVGGMFPAVAFVAGTVANGAADEWRHRQLAEESLSIAEKIKALHQFNKTCEELNTEIDRVLELKNELNPKK
jgi:hypothetical protein